MSTSSAVPPERDVHARLLFGLLVAMCMAVGVALATPEPRDAGGAPIGHGIAHPSVPAMARGGDGRARFELVLWPAASFGAGLMSFAAVTLHLGIRRRGGAGNLGRWIVVAGVMGTVAMGAVFISYRGMVGSPDPAYVLGLPVATAWVVYGIFGFPLVLVAAWLSLFDREFWTPESRRRFAELLRARADDDERRGTRP